MLYISAGQTSLLQVQWDFSIGTCLYVAYFWMTKKIHALLSHCSSTKWEGGEGALIRFHRCLENSNKRPSFCAVSRTNSGSSIRIQRSLKSPFSRSIHSKPSIPPPLICSSNHGVKRCRSPGLLNVASHLAARSSNETFILDNIFGFLQFRVMRYVRITTQFKRF